MTLFDIAERKDSDNNVDGVALTTLHAAKGLEYPHVYLAGFEENLIPHRSSIEQDTIEEERRLAYVGITRAQRTLTMSFSRTRKRYGQIESLRAEPLPRRIARRRTGLGRPRQRRRGEPRRRTRHPGQLETTVEYMTPLSQKIRTLIGVLAFCPLALAAADNAYEEFDEVAVESVVPTKFLHSAHYAIEPRVRADENFYQFTVTTDSATYNITSLEMLRIRLHEIVTMAELEPRLAAKKVRLERSPGGRYGVESERVLDIFTDPVSTATKLLSNIEYNVEKTFQGVDPSDVPKLGGRSEQDLDPGPHKRSAAAQLGVDVYSSNQQLQQLLNAVAQARSAGKVQSSISPLIRNIYAAAPFGSGVLNQRLDSHLKNSSSADLHAEIRGSLHDLEVPDALSIAFSLIRRTRRVRVCT